MTNFARVPYLPRSLQGAQPASEEPTSANVRRVLRGILRTRAFESVITEHGRAGHIGAAFHGSTGHEWIAEVVCSMLKREDWIVPYYRSHHWLLARGAPATEVADRIRSAPTSPAGSAFHLADPSRNVVLSPAIVGQEIPIAVGIALASNGGVLTVCSLGDGAQAPGVWWESLQLATMWRLPVLFVIEDNGLQNYGCSADLGSAADLYESMPGTLAKVAVFQGDVIGSLSAVGQLMAEVRESRIPGLLHCETGLEVSHSVSREGDIVEASRLARTDRVLGWEADEAEGLFPRGLTSQFSIAGVSESELCLVKEEASALRAFLTEQFR